MRSFQISGEVMKVTREKTENSEAHLTIEVEPTELEESLQSSYLRLVKKAKIPGFRKGKAPRLIVERYLGKESLFEDALGELIPQVYEKAIKEENIEAIAQPSIEITQTDPVVLKATVPLKPTIKPGDYHQLKLTPNKVKITQDDINAAIERLRHEYATWEPVERPVELKDLAVLDVEAISENKPIIDQKGVQYQVLDNLPFPAPGFSQELVGMKINEEKEFKLKFPSDYARGELAGKEAHFKVKISEIKQEKLPQLDDEFARGVDPELENMSKLREKVTEGLETQAEEKASRDFEEKVVAAVVDIFKVEFPPILVEWEINRLMDEQLQRWQMSGGRVEDYLESIKKTEQELRQELHPLSSKRVTRSLVMEKVSSEEKIEVSDTEIEAEIKNMIGTSAEDKEKLGKFLNTPQAQQSIKRMLVRRKTVERLVEIAKGSKKKK